MSSLLLDLRHAVRGLGQRPALTMAATVSLALGLGTTAILFGIVDRLLIRPPPHVQAPGEIFRLYYADPNSLSASPWTSFPTYELLRDRLSGLSGLAAQASKTLVIGRGADAREVTAEFVTGNALPMLGVKPVLGRYFQDGEDQALRSTSLVLGFGLWQSAFGGSRDVLGDTVFVGNRPFSIVGVAPPGFNGIDQTRVDVWLPIEAASQLVSATALVSPTSYWICVFGRLGRTPAAQVGAQAATILRATRPLDGPDREINVIVGSVMSESGPSRSSTTRLPIWLAMSSVLLLMIACANNANLMLVRCVSRLDEFSIRAALGASRAHLVRHVLLDIGIVTAMGAACAAILVGWAGSVARALLVPGLDVSGGELDLRSGLQLAILASIAGVASALPPAFFVGTRRFAVDPGIPTSVRSPRQRATANALIVFQCAVSVLLLIGAGLFSRSLKNVTSIDLGLDVDHVIYAKADLRANLSRADSIALYQRLAERVGAIPGVEKVAVAMGLPLETLWAVATTLPGEVWDGPNQIMLGHAVGAGYFETTGLLITRGRSFEPQEYVSGAQVAVINETFARKFWPAANPLGACLRLGSDRFCTQVVGVASNTPRASITADREYEVYVPIRPGGYGDKYTLALAIRTPTATKRLIAAVRTTIQSENPAIAFAAVTPVSTILAPQLRPWRIGTTLFSTFGFVAVVLAGVGLYGLLAFAVARESHSIGVQMALGASAQRVRRRVVVTGTSICALGAAIGLAGALILAPAARSMVFGVSVHDPLVFSGAAAVLVVVGLLASYVPARRAARLDIATLLRAR